ncbi:MAG TPA: ABC transporter permease [Verrucomicrobiae bacterium]
MFAKRKLDAEMDEELRSHIELRTQANIEAGMNPDQARHAAAREFGWAESIKDDCRDQRGVQWIENFFQDVRFGVRQLCKNPGFTFVAVICVALGIGATTGIFSVLNAVLLRPLHYARPEQLARLYTEFPGFANGGGQRFGFSQPEYLDLKCDVKQWESIQAYQTGDVNLAGQNEPVRVRAAAVTGGMLNMLGVPAIEGRLVAAEDDKPGAPLSANISFGLWKRVFGADANIVGRDILVDGTKYSVVGVMPQSFSFPPGELDSPDVWVPMQLDTAKPGGRTEHNLSVLGRLKPGITIAQGRADLDSFAQRIQMTAAADSHGFGSKDHPIRSYGLHDEVVRGVKPALRMLLGAVCFVLLIACVNVANLLLARAEARRKELAIRGALGASLRRLTLQFVTEGLLLSFIGVVLGLFLAYGGLQLVKSATAGSLPLASEITIDLRVVLFAISICAVTGLVFGLAPILHVARHDFQNSLKSAATSTTGSAETQRSRHLLVVSELAVALVLLIGAGLMLRAFWNLQKVHAGFDPAGIVTACVSLPRASYSNTRAKMSFWTRLEERLAVLPGIENAALVTGLPPSKSPNYNDTDIEGFVFTPGGPMQNVDFYQSVSKNYFKTLGIRLIEGRLIDQRDGPGAPDVAVINQTMARMFWKGESPIGHRIRPRRDIKEWCTVIGVVEDVKNHGLENNAGTEIYLSMGQTYARDAGDYYVALRSRGQPAAAITALRREIHDLDPSLPLSRVRTLDDVVSAAQSRPRFFTMLLATFSGVALVLAAVGIYGVISYSVAQRTREFGLRMALGAQRGDVLGLVMGRGMLLALAGIVIGLSGAFVLTRFLSTLLFGVTPTDPATFAVVSALMGAVAFFASYIPARRATRVDPMVALRHE